VTTFPISFELVSTSAAADVTVTDSCPFATVSVTSSRTVCATLSSTPLRSAVPNPRASTVRSYALAGSVRWKDPDSVVTWLRANPVSGFNARTVAPRTTAPDGSSTRPSITPAVS